MSKHTQGTLAERNGRIYCADRENLTIANVARSSDGDYSPANARRLVACWNACIGISTENLEDNILNIGADGVITNWIAAIDPEEWKWSTPPAADKQEKRHMDIGRAIERACAELPEGVEISISLEHHAGTVTLIDSNGNEDDYFDHECGLAGTINQAIAAAIAASKEKAK